MLRLGLIGCGYWGPNLIRNFIKLQECKVVAVADRDVEKRDSMKFLYPSLETYDSGEALLSQSDVDAVAIATPVSTHFELAQAALLRGRHVLLEKPMTATVDQAEELVKVAEQRRKVLMLDHTFVYTGAVRKIRDLIGSGELGEIYYYDSVRVNLGLFRNEINVLWDLGPHDFSIMSYLIDARPVRISAIGARPVRENNWVQESIAYVTVWFSNDLLAHFHLNWLSPVKVRRTLIGGSRKMIVYDQLDPDNQLKIFDKGVNVQAGDPNQMLVQYRLGDMLAPKVDQKEALEHVCKHFVECVREGVRPTTDGLAGLQVMKLLEAAQQSINDHGKVVNL